MYITTFVIDIIPYHVLCTMYIIDILPEHVEHPG